jgi:CRP-like cAMP-binding protein
MKTTGCTRSAVLGTHFLLRHLQPEELQQLAAHASIVQHHASTTIFRKGDPGNSLMAVVSGQVKICAFSADGKEVILNIIATGGLFGEIAVLDGAPRSADAVAIADTELLVLERRHLMPFLSGNPEVATRLIGVLCQRLRQTSEQLEDALLRNAPARLASCLLRLGHSLGRSDGRAIRLNIRLSQQQLGNLIGVSRESVNKMLGEWSRAGYLSVRSGQINIQDAAILQKLAEAEL